MLEKLTKEQENLIPIVRDRWIDYCSNLKLDKVKSKKYIEWLYEFSKLKKPKVLFFNSPLAVQYGLNQVIWEYLNFINISSR